MARFTNLQENNIMIPKDSKRKDEKISEHVGEDDYQNYLQEEVRKLHYQLKQKENTIEKLKQVFADEGSDKKKISNLIEKDE